MDHPPGNWIVAAIFAAGFLVSLATGKTLGPGDALIVKRSEAPRWYWFMMFWLALASVLAALGHASLLASRHGLSALVPDS